MGKKIVRPAGWPEDMPKRQVPEYGNPADYDRGPTGGRIGRIPDNDEDEAPKKAPRRGAMKTPPEPEHRIKVSVYLPTELERNLRYRMIEDRATMSDIVTAALEEYL